MRETKAESSSEFVDKYQMETSYIYLLTNTINNKKYVGVSKNPLRRLTKGHVYGRGAIGAAIQKYGIESFSLETLLKASTAECYELEDRMFEVFQSRCTQHGYNLARGGVIPSPMAGVYKRSAETRSRMSEAQKGKRHSDETRMRISEAKKGIPVSEERRRQIIEGLTGREVSEETRRKISAKQIGKSVSAETRTKLSEAHTGKKWTDAQRKAREQTPARNKSGYKGVSQRGNLWRAVIGQDGKFRHLGYFSSPEEAHSAYIAAKRKAAEPN